jgi:hypothetical protein
MDRQDFRGVASGGRGPQKSGLQNSPQSKGMCIELGQSVLVTITGGGLTSSK